MSRTRPRVVAAVDVGGTTIKSGLVTVDGELLSDHRTPVASVRPGGIVDAVIAAVQQLMLETKSGLAAKVVAIGLAVPGVVDEGSGIGRSSMILGWRDVPFLELLRVFDRPVVFSHDVSAGAFAESRRGAATGHQDWLFLALGTGLGSTFVLGGRPYRGAGGTGGELAHLVVRPDGPTCRCGKQGCLEMISTAPAVAQAYAARTGMSEPGLSAADVASRVSSDPTARAVWGEALEALADALAGYVETMNPSVVVVGGGLADAAEVLLDPLERAVRARVRFADPVPRIALAVHRSAAALHGVAIAGHDLADRGLSFGIPFGLTESSDQLSSSQRTSHRLSTHQIASMSSS